MLLDVLDALMETAELLGPSESGRSDALGVGICDDARISEMLLG